MISLGSPINLVPFVAVDVETTGLEPSRDEIVEIGAIKVVGGSVVDEFSTLVYIDRTIPFAARRIHGISNDMLVGQPRIAEALRLLFYFLGDGALVEHSFKAFDIAFLEHAHGAPLTMPCINTCTLSRRLFPMFRSHSLTECCRRFRITNQHQHRALSDARATAELLVHLLAVGGTRYPRLHDLMTVAAVERG